LLASIIEEERNKATHMNKELLNNISALLDQFTNARTDNLKNAFDIVHDSIQRNVNYILFTSIGNNLKELYMNILLFLT